jgi:transcriptional regulator with XRE-family HTH domain
MHRGPECIRCRAMAQARLVDPVLNLREARRRSGLTQTEVARLSGVGAKTISSFETGGRIASIKLFQLTKLLRVYGMTLGEFFHWSPDDEFLIEPDGDDHVQL